MLPALLPLLATQMPPPIPGIYSNVEEVYFDREAKRAVAPLIFIRVDNSGQVTFVDDFGRPTTAATFDTINFDPDAPPGVLMKLHDGPVTRLRRARPVTCWAAALKARKKPDGSEDWYGARDLKLHDQGGKAAFGGGDTGADAVQIKVRNVVWPSGPNRPSLVLYVYRPSDPERAVSYSWADPGAVRIGINLRWMQASCTVDDKEETR